jgi:hypothetical protein
MRHSFLTTALWKTNQRNAAFFYTLALCHIVFHLGKVEGGDFVMPLVRDCLLEVNLLIDPLPPFFGGVSKEGGNLSPPPMSRVKKKVN